jgi:hypothetical protein
MISQTVSLQLQNLDAFEALPKMRRRGTIGRSPELRIPMPFLPSCVHDGRLCTGEGLLSGAYQDLVGVLQGVAPIPGIQG